jgi:hypothetical protein
VRVGVQDQRGIVRHASDVEPGAAV